MQPQDTVLRKEFQEYRVPGSVAPFFTHEFFSEARRLHVPIMGEAPPDGYFWHGKKHPSIVIICPRMSACMLRAVMDLFVCVSASFVPEGPRVISLSTKIRLDPPPPGLADRGASVLFWQT